MKKMSLSNLLKEDDALQHDKNLKSDIDSIVKLSNALQGQLKSDAYEQAVHTLASLAYVSQQAQQRLQAVIQKTPQVKNPGVQPPQPSRNNISDKEI